MIKNRSNTHRHMNAIIIHEPGIIIDRIKANVYSQKLLAQQTVAPLLRCDRLGNEAPLLAMQ